VALSVDTAAGRVALAPVLVGQSNSKQRVKFDGEEPARFTRRRCEQIGCSTQVADEAERGCAALIGPEPAVVLTGDEPLTRMIQAASHGHPHSRS